MTVRIDIIRIEINVDISLNKCNLSSATKKNSPMHWTINF